jgi:hypothetical protein
VTLKSRIPVEQLDDERLTQIERRIVASAADRIAAHAPAPRRYLGWAGMAFALAAAVVVGWQLRGGDRAAPPSSATEVAQTFALHTTSEHSLLELGDATLASDPGSTLDVTRAATRVVVQMTRGRIELAVKHREDRVVVVRAGETEIEDVGTKFSVAYDGASAVDVRVTEGSVKVTKAHRSVTVAAGYAWTTERGLVAIADLVSPSARSGAGAGAAVAVVEPDRPVVAPVAPAAPAAPAVATVRPAPRPRPERVERPAAATPRAAVVSDPYVELKVAIRNQPIGLDPKLDGQRDAAAEVTRLKPIAYSPQKYGGEASQALYKMAVLLYKPLRQDAEALRTLDMYQRRFHGTKELEPALWLRVRITCAHAIDDECRRAAYSYQQAEPSGPAADVAIRITNSP